MASIASAAWDRFGGCCDRWMAPSSKSPMRWVDTMTSAGVSASCSCTAAISRARASARSASSGDRASREGSSEGAASEPTGCSPSGVQRVLMGCVQSWVGGGDAPPVPCRRRPWYSRRPQQSGKRGSPHPATHGEPGSSPPMQSVADRHPRNRRSSPVPGALVGPGATGGCRLSDTRLLPFSASTCSTSGAGEAFPYPTRKGTCVTHRSDEQ